MRPLPWLTAALPGSGGRLEASSEDFVVHETLAYAPCGQGEHLLVHIEKIDLTTVDAAHRVARAAGVPGKSAGFAGMKDKNARARQWISVPWPQKQPVPELEVEGVRVLEVGRHTNKIKRGHVRENRFEIRVRGVTPDGVHAARATLEALRRSGVPNGFGPQRFGRDADNPDRARAWLSGAERPSGPPRIRALIYSALQSELFNRVLAARIEGGTFDRALMGDVMKKHATGGMFDVTDPDVEQPRVDRLEISPTGPMFGQKTRPSSGEAHAIEAAVLEAEGLGPKELKKLGPGTRRPLRYPLGEDAAIDAVEDGYVLKVTLPSGAFATEVLSELMKPEGRAVLRELDAGD